MDLLNTLSFKTLLHNIENIIEKAIDDILPVYPEVKKHISNEYIQAGRIDALQYLISKTINQTPFLVELINQALLEELLASGHNEEAARVASQILLPTQVFQNVLNTSVENIGSALTTLDRQDCIGKRNFIMEQTVSCILEFYSNKEALYINETHRYDLRSQRVVPIEGIVNGH